MEAVLSVQHINKHYPGFALENVSFSLAPNHIMGLIGKNGAGKSTTLKAILNMVSPESGSVTMFHKNFYQHEKECKQKVGVVFGGIDFYPLKKLSTITAVTRKFYTNWDQAQYQKYIKHFALDENKKFKELSNGMKVKYLLALALSHHAELLILDEPINGLDPIGIAEVRSFIRELCDARGKTILISSHILDELSRLATHYGFLDRGRLVKEMSAGQLEASARKSIRVEVSDIRALVRGLDALGLEYTICSDKEADIYGEISVTRLVLALSKEGCEILQIRKQDESLESYYMTLLGGEDHE